MTEPPLPEESLFAQALEIASATERAAFLDRACGENAAVRAEVEALLRASERSGDLLDLPDNPVRTTDLPARESPGTVIGPYKLLEQVGEGGMGTVWMAEQTDPIRRRVAVKVVKEGMDSKQVLARFEAERQALALMDHPNIAKVLDAGKTPAGQPYFVMELVKGQPITKYCDEKRLGVRERLDLFGAVCRAVQHAHQKGIIHRDLKPSNVLVAPYDGKPVVKVIDFGVAKATGQRLTDKTLFTGIGALVGTPEYMSPEQAEVNNQDIDTRSDIYALGVLLYELLTGSTPLTRKRMKEAALLEMLRVIREEEPPRPSTRLSESKASLPSISAQRQTEPAKLTKLVRGELDWIVMKALEKDRNRRYDTANGFAADIQRYLADEPVQACPPSLGYRFGKFARRNKGALLTAALVAGALLVGTVVSTTQAIRAWEAEEVAQEDRSRAEELARTEAEAHTRAREQTELAKRRAEDLARRLYIYRVNLAHREALVDNVAQADALLAGCEPARRGWEWEYSKRLCHLEALTLGGFSDHAAAVAGARHGSPGAGAQGDHALESLIRLLMAVSGSVRGVAYSPDGKQIATAHDDGAVVLWDARTGREIRSLVGHVGSVSSVSFDADGRRLVSGGYDRTVRVWDVNTGEPKLVLRGHSQPVMRVAFRPGADQVASSAFGGLETFHGQGFEIKQWDLATGREVRTLYHRHGWQYTSVAFSPDGRRLLSSATWGGYLRSWDAETGKEVEERRILENSLGLAVSSVDGRIAFGGMGNVVGLVDPRPGAGFRSFRGHSGGILGVAFSPDGTRLASASADGTVKIWNVADGREVKHLRGHTGSVTAVAFSRDGNSLVSGSEDGTVKVWDVTHVRDPFPLTMVGWAPRVRFAPDGRRTAIAYFSGVTVADAVTNRPICQIRPAGGPSGLAYSRDGRLLAICTYAPDQVSLWNAETGQPIATCQGHTGAIRSVTFGSGQLLASGGDDGTVRLWDAADPSAHAGVRAGLVLRAHEGGVLAVVFDPAGATLATVGWNGAVRLWEMPSGRLIRQLGTTVQRVAGEWGDVPGFSPDGRRLAVAGRDGTTHVWEVATGSEVLTLRGHTREVNGVAYSPDGRRIATWGGDRTIKLWDAATGDELFTLRGHTGTVLGLAYSPDGYRILSSSGDGQVWTWDTMPQKPRAK